ncbi:26970_t:CDS:2, partial [Dentiscutata erythropus]
KIRTINQKNQNGIGDFELKCSANRELLSTDFKRGIDKIRMINQNGIGDFKLK